MVKNVSHQVATRAQQLLSITDLREKLDRVLGWVERFQVVESRLEELRRLFPLLTDVEELTRKVQLLQDQADNLYARAGLTQDDLHRLANYTERLRSIVDTGLAGQPPRLPRWQPIRLSSDSATDSILAQFLYNFLPNRVLVEVGAGKGEFAQAAGAAGYQVFAFESDPAAFADLNTASHQEETVASFHYRVGASRTDPAPAQGQDSSNSLDPSGSQLSKAGSESGAAPPELTLEFLAGSAVIPLQIDFLRLTENQNGLEIIQGLGSIRPAVIQWLYPPSTVSPAPRPSFDVPASSFMVREMKKLGYHWNAFIFRFHDEQGLRCATNLQEPPADASGSALFFREYSLFKNVLDWFRTG